MKKWQVDNSQITSTTNESFSRKQKFIEITQKRNLNKLQNQDKTKQKGKIFSFINEKLNEWPLWIKIASSLQDETLKPITKNTKLKEIKTLPMVEAIGRGGVFRYYKYYHCKLDNNTYFYPHKILYQKIYNLDLIYNHQILQPPKQQKQVYFMPTVVARQKINEAIRNNQKYK